MNTNTKAGISYLLRKGYILICTFLALAGSSLYGTESNLNWTKLPPLPLSSGMEIQTGLAGGFAGVHNGVMIFAGGTNFPDDPLWEGGAKQWWSDLFVLTRNNERDYSWLKRSFNLSTPLAYGVSISSNDGVILIGGCNQDICSDETVLVSWNNIIEEITIDDYPRLPVPLAYMTGTMVNNVIYIAGGQENMTTPTATNHFFRLNLANKGSEDFQWEALPSWNGKPRSVAVSATQSNGVDNCFYLFSGRDYGPDREIEVLQDAHCFNPRTGTWTTIGNEEQQKFPFMAGSCFPIGVNHIVFLGGSDMRENSPEAPITDHPGFSRDVRAFNTITNRVFDLGKMPFPAPVTTTLVHWGNEYILPAGEIRPGIRTPEVWKMDIKEPERKFGTLNTIVLLLYFGILIGIGVFFSRRQKSTFDYFRGGERLPWWVTGLSLFGTAVSAITFIAILAKSYATDWTYLFYNFGIVLITPVVILVFIPLFRRLNVTTAYEYLEKRFNLLVRLLGSISFIIFHIGRIGIVLYLTSIALSVATGFDIMTCILMVGVISMLYTIIGGIEAVIWTDALHVAILLGGAIFCVVLMASSVENGFVGILNQAKMDDKLKVFDLAFDLNNSTFLVVLFGGFFSSFILYGTDQTMVQRYFTTKDEKAANNSVLTSVVLSIIATILFFFIGSALYVFYKNYPTELDPTLTAGESIFPWYIFYNLPKGISGIMISGILAVSMSTLSSSMNSGATSYFTDIHNRLIKVKSDSTLRVARIATLVIGLLGIVFAVMLANMDIKSIWDEFQKILGLIIGGLGGVFMLGIFTKRANSIGALIGVIASSVIQFLLSLHHEVHFQLFTATGVVSCFIIGYVTSFLSKPKKRIDNLTIRSIGHF